MSWAKLDDQFFAHPKIINLSKDAKLLQLAAITYCAGQLTDGLVTPGAVRMICAQVDVEAATVQELLAARVWDADGKNYRIHDYLVYNPSGEQVRSERAKTAQRVADWRANHPKSNGVTNRVRNGVSTPAPSPSPYPNDNHTSEGEDISSSFVADVSTPTEGEPLKRTRKHTSRKPVQEPTPRVNPLWDVLVDIFDAPATDTEKSNYGKAVRELKAANATPDEIRRRVANHSGDWDLTINALLKHWTELGRAPNPSRPRQNGRAAVPEIPSTIPRLSD